MDDMLGCVKKKRKRLTGMYEGKKSRSVRVRFVVDVEEVSSDQAETDDGSTKKRAKGKG